MLNSIETFIIRICTPNSKPRHFFPLKICLPAWRIEGFEHLLLAGFMFLDPKSM